MQRRRLQLTTAPNGREEYEAWERRREAEDEEMAVAIRCRWTARGCPDSPLDGGCQDCPVYRDMQKVKEAPIDRT